MFQQLMHSFKLHLRLYSHVFITFELHLLHATIELFLSHSEQKLPQFEHIIFLQIEHNKEHLLQHIFIQDLHLTPQFFLHIFLPQQLHKTSDKFVLQIEHLGKHAEQLIKSL